MFIIRKTVLYMQFYMVRFSRVYASSVEHILQPARAYYDIVFLIVIFGEYLVTKDTK
jgi:hypothetical protein